jgi:heme peroxidase
MLTRRRFLKAFGSAAITAGTARLLPGQPAEAQVITRRFVIREDRFGRMFPTLPPFDSHITAAKRDAFTAALRDIGRPGGMLDAHDDLGKGAVALIVDPTLSVNNPNNPTMTAGATFMGQFMDHDMTFDLSSRLNVATDPAASANSRTPAFDLDSVYGAGPGIDTKFYATGKSGNATKFKVESGGLFEDVPRNRDDRSAIISDPRNDENIIISGLQAAFLLFHNRAVDLINTQTPNESADEVFSKARQLTTWHYQWMVVHEFLPKFVGQAVVDDIMRNGRKFYTPPVAQIPVEFQGAAYRFGHSIVRPSYRANLAGDEGQPFFALTFDGTQAFKLDPEDLRGGCRAPRRFIGWQTFFDFGSIPRPGSQGGVLRDDVRPNKLIDTHISTPLFDLPIGTIASGQPPTSLPERNLLRQVTWGLPSGQSIAQFMHVPMLSKHDLEILKDYRLGLDESTPLWFYILKEAELMAGGQHLGPVGGRIVGEVIIGLIQLDPDSYASSPGWRPTLPTITGQVTGDFRMIDFLAFAKVDPTSRRQ